MNWGLDSYEPRLFSEEFLLEYDKAKQYSGRYDKNGFFMHDFLPDLDGVLEEYYKQVDEARRAYITGEQLLLDKFCDKWNLSKHFSWQFYYGYVDGLCSLDERYKDKQAMLSDLYMIDPNPEMYLLFNQCENSWRAIDHKAEDKIKENKKRWKYANNILTKLDLDIQKQKKQVKDELTFYNPTLS